jgi:hypothetical protein
LVDALAAPDRFLARSGRQGHGHSARRRPFDLGALVTMISIEAMLRPYDSLEAGFFRPE